MHLRAAKRVILNNSYILTGILLGFFLSYNFSDDGCSQESGGPLEGFSAISDMNTSRLFTVKPHPTKKTEAKKPTEKLVRPRYYSTELGIREKLFVGVLTSEDKINTQAVHINKTIAHLVDKIKFFITTQHKLKNQLSLSGIVGFTDTRHRYRPFQIIKYIGDTYLQDYDYYFLMNDYDYVNVRRLKELVAKVSVSYDVYLGTSAKDSSFCDLDAGILISNSVLRAMKENIEWCTMNAVSEDHSENLGRCVHHSVNLECMAEAQGQRIDSFKLRHFELETHLKKLTKSPSFNRAVTVYPILQENDFYLLNAYFSQLKLNDIRKEIERLSKDLRESWPPGQRPGSRPATRFDLPPQNYFNMTHLFFPDDFTNVKEHSKADLMDITRVIEAIKSKVDPNGFEFRRLINGYRSFDLSRGMDYQIDLAFRDLTTGKEAVKRFQVCKPLGKVELIPVPYVTENTRITMLLPIEEDQIELGLDFLDFYTKTIMERHEKSFLMLVFLYRYESASKGDGDVFGRVKTVAVKLSNKYRNDDTKIAWVSIRLPKSDSKLTLRKKDGVLGFAVIDLALRKIGLDNLILVLDVHAEIAGDFLNRVRMNTIVNFQIFSPIPFRQYNPAITQYEKLEIQKSIGHFDPEEYRYVSFYAKDYVSARKKIQNLIPLIRTDNDIAKLLSNERGAGNVFEMFVKHSEDLHCMRATDMSLKIKYHDSEEGRANLFLGSKAQLAQLILKQESLDGLF